MGDLFISYKAEDRSRLGPLVAALQADGIDLWWDVQIEGGAMWRQAIQERLDAAKCVLVVWSKGSIGPEGRFVHDEAAHAQRRGIYLPIRIDRVEPPIGFGEVQILDLIGWRGKRADPRYQAVLGCIRAMLEGTGKPPPRILVEPPRFDRRTLIAGGAAATLLVAGSGWWFGRRLLTHPRTGSIAVLPFANLSGDPSQTYFSDGLSEELRASLSRIAGLEVAARTSSELFRDARDVIAVARKLGVAWLLEGSVRRDAALIRVNSQLIDGHSGLQQWSESYDQPRGDVLAIQTAIAEKVAAALQVTLGGQDRAAIRAGRTHAAAAHDLYLQGVALFSSLGTEQSYRDAIARFEAAIAIDPDYAEAYAARARVLWALSNEYDDDAAAAVHATEALASAKRAVALAPGLARAEATLGEVLAGQLRSAEALPYYERARALGPGDPEILSSYAGFITRFGRVGQAYDAALRATRLDPLNPRAFGLLGGILIAGRRYEEAIVALRKALALNPKGAFLHWSIGDSLILLGRYDAALAELALEPVDWTRLTSQAIAYWRKGDRAASDNALAELRARYGRRAAYQLAQVFAQRGDKAGALDALDQAWIMHDGGLVRLKTDPMLDPIRREPRFQALLQRLGLA